MLENSLLETEIVKWSNLELSCGVVFLIGRVFKRKDWSEEVYKIMGID